MLFSLVVVLVLGGSLFFSFFKNQLWANRQRQEAANLSLSPFLPIGGGNGDVLAGEV